MNHTLERIADYLLRAEMREPDVWLRQDYRLAWLILMLAAEDMANPYSKAFRQLFHKNAHEVRFWWRDRRKLLWLAEATNCPTPLLVANRVEEVFNVVPDYDPTIKLGPLKRTGSGLKRLTWRAVSE